MTPFQNPSVELFGIRIDEPVTSGTDVIVASIGIIAFFKTRGSNNRHINCYRYFFLLLAISTLFGAIIGHAFNYQFGGIDAKVPGWIFGVFGVGFAQFAVLYNAREVLGNSLFKNLVILNTVELLFVLVMIFVKKSFVVVEIHSAFGLAVMVSALEAINYSKTRSQLSRNMLYGVGFAALAVVAHIAKLAPSVWFNHMDVGHVFMAIGLYIMYKGVSHEQKKLAET